MAEADSLLSVDAEFLKNLVSLLQKVISAPVALVSFVTDDAQNFKAANGLGAPYDVTLTTPLSHSFCQHVVKTGRPFQVDDAKSHPVVCKNMAIEDLNVKAYAGFPIYNPDGLILGSLCVIDTQSREWNERDFSVLEGFAQTITSELSSRRAQKLRLDEQWAHNTKSRALVEALQATKSGVWFWNETEQKSYWPAETCALFGFPNGEHPRTLDEFMTYLSPRDLEHFKRTTKAQLNSGNLYDVEVRLNAPLWDRPRWIRSSGQMERDSNGRIREIAGFMTDIDDAVRARLQNERLARRFKRITNHAPVMIAELDSQLRYKFANTSYAALFDITAELMIGQMAKDVMGETLFAKTEHRMKTALKGNLVEYDLTIERDGSAPRYLKARYAPEINGEGEVVSLIAAVIDLTDQTLLAQKADTLDQRLKAAHHLSPDGFMVFNSLRDDQNTISDFRFEYVNKAGADIAGHEIAYLLGRNLLEVLPGNKDEGLFDSYVDVVETGEPFEAVNHYEHDDLDLWIEITAIKLGDGFAVSFADITKRKNDELYKDLLVGELNHRVKNSLATIQAMARQTIRSSDNLQEFETTFSARLGAITAAHEILMDSTQGRASLRTMIKRQVGPYVDDTAGQLTLSGSDVMLSGTSAHAIGLVLHELSTNAAKYGGLSLKKSSVDISWTDTDDGMVHIVWREMNGPPVTPPTRKGFGTRLIKQSLEYSLGGKTQLDYAPDGFIAKLSLPKEAVDE